MAGQIAPLSPLRALLPVTLHKAIVDGKDNLDEIKALIHPERVNSKDSFGASSLKLACGNRDAVVIECVIDAGADIHERMGRYEYTVLHVAAGAGYTALVQRLLNDRANIDVQSRDGRTPVFEACQNLQIAVVKMLMIAGAKLHLKAEKDWTCLHVAAAKCQEDLVEVLCSFLFKTPEHLNAKTKSGTVFPFQGYTPLYLACQCNGKSKSVEALLKAEADVNALNGPENETVLHLAAKKGDEAQIRAFLEAGADVNAKTKSRLTPLFLAYLHGHIEAGRVLAEAGAFVNETCGPDGETSLYLVIRDGREGLAGYLLGKGGQANVKNKKHIAPLYAASQVGNYDAAEALLRAGAEINAVNGKNEERALYAAVNCGSAPLVRLLLQYQAKHFFVRDMSLLYLACCQGNLGVAEALLAYSSVVDAQCGTKGERQTALHLVSQQGNVPLIRLLLQSVRLEVKTEDGKTALYLACQNGHVEAARVLLSAGANIEMAGPTKDPQILALIEEEKRKKIEVDRIPKNN